MNRVLLAALLACLSCAHERVVNPLPTSPTGGGDPIGRDVSGGTAPGGIVHGRDGSDVDLAGLWDHDKVVVVFYMGHWCPSCQHQLGDLNAHLQDFTAAGATLVAISTDSVEDAAALHDHLQLKFELFSDPQQTTIQKWGVADFTVGVARPATFVIEPGGEIRYRHLGKTETDRPAVAEVLASVSE